MSVTFPKTFSSHDDDELCFSENRTGQRKGMRRTESETTRSHNTKPCLSCVPIREAELKPTYLKNGVAVVEQVLRRNSSGHVRRGSRDESDGLRGGDVFHNHFQLRQFLYKRLDEGQQTVKEECRVLSRV